MGAGMRQLPARNGVPTDTSLQLDWVFILYSPFQCLANRRFIFHGTTSDFFVVLTLAKEIHSRLFPQLSTVATVKVRRIKRSK